MKRNQSMFTPALRVVAVALALSACGGASSAYPAVAHGTLDLHERLPAPTPAPYEAYGARQPWLGKGATSDAEAAIAPYLRPQAPVERRQMSSLAAGRTPRKPPPVSNDRAALAVSRAASRAPSGEALATAIASKDDARSMATKTEPVSADAERYAQRQNRRLEGYRGGDAIVITAGTVVIVLLILLLVLLLT